MVMVGAQTDLAFSEYQKMWAVEVVGCRGGRRDINHSVHGVPMRANPHTHYDPKHGDFL